MDVSFGVGNPPFRKDTSLGQSLIPRPQEMWGFPEFPLGLKGILDLHNPR